LARLRIVDEDSYRVRVLNTYYIDIPEGEEEEARKDPYEYYFEKHETARSEVDAAQFADQDRFQNVKGYLN
jgi:hypothetical protein